MSDPRYPIGKFDPSIRFDEETRRQAIDDLAATPARLRAAVLGLDDRQLDTPYREGGWTVRQVAHHIPDSHLNGYLRFKLGLTEDSPTIKLYEQGLWAELPEARTAPIAVSLTLLEALHERRTPRVGSCRSTTCSRSTPGTAGTMWGISMPCASTWAGPDAWSSRAPTATTSTPSWAPSSTWRSSSRSRCC
jgi:hypothetical protein